MEPPSVADAFQQRLAAITDAIAQASFASADPHDNRRMPLEQVRPIVERAMWLLHRDLVEGGTNHYASSWDQQAPNTARAGLPLAVVLGFIAITEREVVAQLAPAYAADASAMRAMIEQIYTICDNAKMRLFHAYSNAREEIIREQTAAIAELSAPIIPILRGILVLPLIGAINGRRAGAIMETLLSGVSQQGASVVLLDITGVPVVDTGVAQHLMQAAQAVRLLGAEIVLVGISPEIAQTIIQLGLDLSNLTTRSDLQAGLSYALQRLGLTITSDGRAAG
jgi:rsbT co-antagonist protein RsbR